jgi:YbbR domain-containing protein
VPDIDDEPAPGFEVAHVTADPATVEVSGPTSAVNSVTEATTEPVSVRGATKPVIDTVTVGVPDSIVRLRSSRSAIVTVDIRPVRIERVITHVPVAFRSAAAGIHATSRPAEVAVRVKGAASAVTAIRPGDLQVYADLSGLVRGRYNLPVRFDQPADVAIVGLEPAQLDVRLR